MLLLLQLLSFVPNNMNILKRFHHPKSQKTDGYKNLMKDSKCPELVYFKDVYRRFNPNNIFI